MPGSQKGWCSSYGGVWYRRGWTGGTCLPAAARLGPAFAERVWQWQTRSVGIDAKMTECVPAERVSGSAIASFLGSPNVYINMSTPLLLAWNVEGTYPHSVRSRLLQPLLSLIGKVHRRKMSYYIDSYL